VDVIGFVAQESEDLIKRKSIRLAFGGQRGALGSV
jgi:hypothetical protein